MQWLVEREGVGLGFFWFVFSRVCLIICETAYCCICHQKKLETAQSENSLIKYLLRGEVL